jgi:NitT/TauT family transport system substrate-binding protein
MNIRSHLLTAGVAGLALVAALTGCRDSRTVAASADGTPHVKIVVPGLDKVIYLPAKLTERLGYFKQEGVDVEFLDQPGGGSSAENVLIAGDVQGVFGFYDHSIDLQAKGKCIESVVQFAAVPGEVEIVAAGKAGELTSPADFKGRRLGITSTGGSTDFLTQALAVRNDVQTDEFTRVKAGTGQTFISALTNGQIDGGMTTDPTAARLTSSGQGKIILDLRTEAGTRAALGGLYPGSSLYMDCAWVEQNKATVQKMAKALVKTLQFIHAHSAEQIAAKMPAEYATGDPKLYVKAINDSKGMFTPDGIMPAEGAKNVLKVLGSFSPSVQGKEDSIDLAKTYTSEFVEAAKG